ncbi:hypothetical protein HPB50_001632 [Hyalomma asiaticum]|uniref:Uncharacterized protein n=1 Tax=Hyalomma asiaticum TaxID=266040 RepID=A0ACB7SJM4_HYAAI|nr:hypothetical protein HPB50_001632 [Hyalomma asiaticum]
MRPIFNTEMRERTRTNQTIRYDGQQEIADKEIAELPLNSCYTRFHGRCVITSRARGFVRPWRVSRMMFRHLADYNYLSGVQRAMW